MFDFFTETDFANELLDELKLFTDSYDGAAVRVNAEAGDVFFCTVRIADSEYKMQKAAAPDGNVKREFKRFVKMSLYRALSSYYAVAMPWGGLTGIRPTKLAYERLQSTGTYDGVADYLREEFCVGERKARTVERILRTQRDCVSALRNKVDLYVHIPFCDGRCSYCSFPSADMKTHGGLLDGYVDALIREISSVKRLIKRQNKEILSVYVGGGTPSVLSAVQLSQLLAAIDCRGVEFTFEAGRPDSITAEKLSALKAGGVTRVCINPQSLNDITLLSVGRKHTSADFYRTYNLVSAAGFSVNTDVIAGLPGESFVDFRRTLDAIAALSPDNVTVHTLSRKRGSDFAESKLECGETESMMEYAYDCLTAYAYEPYYLYRQKYMVGNLENVGFCKPGKMCVNNVTVMEELVSVYACGAGSISKKITGGKIVRHASAKDVTLYLEQFQERLVRKMEFLGNPSGEKSG